MRLSEGHYLRIPTTEIVGVLSTITIDRAYESLLSSSLTSCQLAPAVRRTIIGRVVNYILAYDNTMGHISSSTDTFALAGRIIQYQLNADWFERPIRFQLGDTQVKAGVGDKDTMAIFILNVFMISCGLPNPRAIAVGATDSTTGPIGTGNYATVTVSPPAMSSVYPASQRLRTGLSSGDSRQWHADIRE